MSTLKIRITLRVNNYNLGFISNFKLVMIMFFKEWTPHDLYSVVIVTVRSLDKNDNTIIINLFRANSNIFKAFYIRLLLFIN